MFVQRMPPCDPGAGGDWGFLRLRSAQAFVESHPSAKSALGWGTHLSKVTDSQDDRAQNAAKGVRPGRICRRRLAVSPRYSLRDPAQNFVSHGVSQRGVLLRIHAEPIHRAEQNYLIAH